MDIVDEYLISHLAKEDTEMLIKRLKALNVNSNLLINGVPIEAHLPEDKTALINLIGSDDIQTIFINEEFDVQIFYCKENRLCDICFSVEKAEKLGIIVHKM